jgi:hypothetical protein
MDDGWYSAAALNHKTKNLLFLFGAAPMGMTGCLGSADDSDSFLTLTTVTTFNNEEETTNNDVDDSESGDGDSGDGDGDSGDGDGDSGDGDGDSGDGDGDSGDGDGDSGDGDGDSGDGDGDSGDGDGDSGDGDIADLCTPYAENLADCYGPEYLETAYGYCSNYYTMFQNDPACLSAYEAFIVCLSSVPCGDFSEATGCESELADFQNTCA